MTRSRARRMGVERWLADVKDSARSLGDARAVHRLRVGLERLRIWALLADAEGARGELRWARRQAAAVRDIDVCLALRPPPRIAAALREARPPLQRRLERSLASRRFSSVIDALQATPAPSRPSAARRAGAVVRRALAQVKATHERRWTARSVHALRRALRRSRYALDWLGEPSEDLEALQQVLGAACDRRMAIRRLRGGPPDQRRYRRRLASELAVIVEASRPRRAEIRAALKKARRKARRGRRGDA